MMEMLSYEFMQRAFLAGLIVALLCPLVGMFVVIRRQSLLGDGLGHIAFAGVTGSALLGINPAIGAVVLTLAAAGGIEIVRICNTAIWGWRCFSTAVWRWQSCAARSRGSRIPV